MNTQLSRMLTLQAEVQTRLDSFPFAFQRIAAADLGPGLMYFGCSVHGQLDLNEDGLIDLAVGSLGNAVVLWLVHLIWHCPLPKVHCNVLMFSGENDLPKS